MTFARDLLKETKKALKQNQKDLELSRNELRNSNEQLKLSAQAQIEIEKTQKIQQFDMLFMTLLSELNLMNTNFIEKEKILDFYKILSQIIK
ncbi:hypothetical protein [Acinetobacter sp. ANC 4862]|uniref:hypothetical protein n=1 Tax=Acinetobacter sp. ANC 4862 TaxID=2529849 RepID=UPI00103D8E5F|nr:hypothetical protein [Acinetobacter sp. ANC 4862]TCH60289.1 hypothetical protein E0409_16390 [Acinetobacter sp. ANC 4862]